MTPVSGRPIALLALAALVLTSVRPAAAQDSTEYTNHLYDKLQASVDFTTVLNNSNARVDGDNGEGTTLDFKSILGVSGTSVQPALGLRWKPGRKTEFDVGYQFINQTGDRSFNDSLVIGDNLLEGGGNIKTTLGSDNATLQFKYALWASERHNIGLAIGFGGIFFDMGFTGSASGSCTGTGCDTSGSGSFDIKKSITIPTGTLGAYGNWRVGDRWYVAADARGIGGKVDRFDISMFEGDVAGRYYFSNRWGATLAWFYTNVTVDVAAKADATLPTNFSGKISYNYSSLRLGAAYTF